MCLKIPNHVYTTQSLVLNIYTRGGYRPHQPPLKYGHECVAFVKIIKNVTHGANRVGQVVRQPHKRNCAFIKKQKKKQTYNTMFGLNSHDACIAHWWCSRSSRTTRVRTHRCTGVLCGDRGGRTGETEWLVVGGAGEKRETVGEWKEREGAGDMA